ncbi:MAG: SPOR domain-containing protein [Holosporales bacterium]|jgi:hypothetical protein|nr:SPOR domain-containing protein [Holosporales bacterium]
MGLFGKKDKADGYFFDQEEDHDPWSLPSVSFFKDKKHRSKKNARQIDDTQFRELSFDRLDESYEKIAEERSLRGGPRAQHEPVDEAHLEINPNQRLFDVYPSLHRNIRRDTERTPPPTRSPRLPPAQPSSQIIRDFTKTERPPERGAASRRVPFESKHAQEEPMYAQQQRALWQAEQMAEQMYAAQSANESISAPDRSREFDESQSRIQDFRFLVKLAITGAVFICCGLVLWWISQQGKYGQDEFDSVPTIPSPKNFKIPNDDSSRLVPLQDALIYGVLNPNEEGERLLKEATKDDSSSDSRDDSDETLETVDSVPIKERKVSSNVSPKSAGFSIPGLNNSAHPPRVVPSPQTNQSNTKTGGAGAEKSAGKIPPKSKNVEHKNSNASSAAKNNEPNALSTAPKTPAYLQIAALLSVEQANKELMRLIRKHRILSRYPISVRPYTNEKGKTIYRLLVGPIEAESDVRTVAKSLGLSGVQPLRLH